MGLEFHKKISKFFHGNWAPWKTRVPKIEFPISGGSLYISEIVVVCKIFSKTVLFGHFSLLSIENYGPSVVYTVSTVCSRAVCHPELGNARPYHLVQAKWDLIGSSDREPLGLILFPVYPIPCLKVTEFDAQNILCGGVKVACIKDIFHCLGWWSIRSSTFIVVSTPSLKIGEQGSHLLLLILMLCLLPIGHIDPSRMRSLVDNKLHHTKDGFQPNSASKNEHRVKYRALYTL